jgi:hypothetical protein
MPLAPEDLAVLAATEEVEIETSLPGGPAHRVIIWVVTDDREAFIRSVRGERGRWYREAVANPRVTIHAPGRSIRARAVPAADADSIARASAGFERKYAEDPSTPFMVVPEVLVTTLRLEPA